MLHDATSAMKASRLSRSTLAMDAKQKRMSHRLTVTLALIFLVSGLWPHMVMSAPTPQQAEGNVFL